MVFLHDFTVYLLRRQGATGEEIVEALIANSATFEKKTQFAQVCLFQGVRSDTEKLLMLIWGQDDCTSQNIGRKDRDRLIWLSAGEIQA